MMKFCLLLNFCLLLASAAIAAASICGGLRAQAYHLCARRLFKHEFVVGERLIHIHFYNVESYVVLLFRAPNLDLGRKQYSIVVLILGVPRVGDQRAGLVINELAVRYKVSVAVNDFASEPRLVDLLTY